MAEWICQGCQYRATHNVYQCSKCKIILCNSCSQYKTYCKDTSKGTAGCDGRLERLDK